MARQRLYKYTSALGYNTRDNPTNIPFESAQIQENLIPNDPNPIPRGGSEAWSNAVGAWSGFGEVQHVFAYKDPLANKLICISFDGISTYIYTKEEGILSSDVLIKTIIGSEFSGDDPCWLRIGKHVYLSNGYNAVYILEMQDDSTFYFRNSNIARPVPGGTPNITATAIVGGSMTPDKYVGYCVTYVRRTDSDGSGNGGVDGSGNPQRQVFNNGDDIFHPGILESVEIVTGPSIPDGTGERVSVQLSGANLQASVVLSNLDQLDEQVTHARISRTLEFDTSVQALGASYRWLGDFPVSGPNDERVAGTTITYIDNKSNATMSGNFNFSLNIGMDNMPAGRTMAFHNGRLWVGGVYNGPDEWRGRAFYSVPPLNIDYPEKWFSMFLTGKASLTIGEALGDSVEVSGWKDTNYIDNEQVQIISISKNDVIFINSLSVWFLADGDPETFEPELITNTGGTEFKNSAVNKDGVIFFLSNNGPARIVGRNVVIMEEHTAGEVWPVLFDNSVGYFHGLSDKNRVQGYFVRDNWILADNDTVVAMYMPDNKKGFGPWKIKFGATIPIKFGIGASFSENDLIVYPYGSSSTQFYKVLCSGVYNDAGVDMTLHQKSKALYVSQKDREKFGEAAELIMFVEFTDSGNLLLVLKSDYYRYQNLWKYLDPDPDHPLQANHYANTFRLNINQPIMEGFLGQLFEIEFYKVYSTPYKFIYKGFSLENIIRHGKNAEFISSNTQDFVGKIIEVGNSPFDYIETGVDNQILEGAT